MKFSVIGGTGRIGTHIVQALTAAGHDAHPHSRSTGVDLLTGQGLARAVAGADAVIDVSQSPTADEDATAFFGASIGNLLDAAREEGTGHIVLLSVLGADQVPNLGYFQAKVFQEDLLKAGPVPYSILRATQFFEYVNEIISWTTDGEAIRLPSTATQPIAAADVARAIADLATAAPLMDTRGIAGPDVMTLDELARVTLAARGDHRTVITDDTAGPFALVPGTAIIANASAHLAPTHYRDWLAA